MDDLKLYARGRTQLEGLLGLVKTFSEDIRMTFGLEKCAAVIIKRGKMMDEKNIVLRSGEEIKSLDTEDRYKYLGLQQTYEIIQSENKDHAKSELMRRIILILKSQLSAKNKIMAINIWAIPSFTYTAGILSWSKTDLQQTDRKIRSTLTQFGLLHPNSAIERLYLPRKEGGRGLNSVENACWNEKENITNSFSKSNLPVHQWIATQVGSPPNTELADEDGPEIRNMLDEFRQRWQSKQLHGRFYASLHMEEVDLSASNTYLTQGYLFPQTEGTIFAIQDQVVPTRNYTHHIMKKQVESTKCRLCNGAEETVQHLSAGCSLLAGTQYLSRHDNMGKVIHQLLCLNRQLIHQFTPHHLYAPASILEDDHTKIYWDIPVTTDVSVEHNRPDMVVWYKREKTATIIDFAVPQDYNMMKTYGEKINKYVPLAWQMKDLWGLKKVNIIPLIMSVNGLVLKRTVTHLGELQLPQSTITWMQKAVILGTVGIIRRTISPH